MKLFLNVFSKLFLIHLRVSNDRFGGIRMTDFTAAIQANAKNHPPLQSIRRALQAEGQSFCLSVSFVFIAGLVP